MKKILIAIMLIITLGLSGCSSDIEEKIPREWAFDETIKEYNRYYGGYRILGYEITGLTISQDIIEEWENSDNYDKNIKFELYQITIINDSGKSKIYNTFIAFEYKSFILDAYITPTRIPYENIYDLDVELNE